jgi:serine phosphatase RsbU (regulator of sigma subunit)/anti-sigma regulatory factor (Ser/Thr protein kinase)
VGLAISIDESNADALSGQAHQVDAALQSTLPSLEDPLLAADGIASSVGTTTFRLFARSLVGPKAPYVSVSLWRVTTGMPRELASVGARPVLRRDPEAFARFLRAVPATAHLAVVSLLAQHVRELGLAERGSGNGSGLVLYAESPLPTTSRITFPASSPFAELSFAIYLGRGTSSGELMERSISLPVRGPSAKETVLFGSAPVTIVATPGGRANGTLPRQLPWLIGSGGLFLTIAAGLSSEHLVRRRQHAELLASDRGRDLDAQRDIADTLQHSLLPETRASHPEVEIASRYVAGAANLDVGGDWLDVITIDDDRLFLTIGDVSGRGLSAARLMGTLRPAIRAYAVQGDDPAEVLRKLDDLVSVVRDGGFATVLCAVVEVSRRRVTLASAGHPPPLLIDRSGAQFVTTPISTPAGVRSPLPPVLSSLFVPPEATLLLYTDGLVERRGRTLHEGLEQLRRAAEGHGGPLEPALDALLSEMLVGGSDDDLALLAVHWTGARAPTSGGDDGGARSGRPWTTPLAGVTTVRSFAGEPTSVATARRFVEDTLRSEGTERLDVISLLVTELCANAVNHARSDFEVTVLQDDVAGVIGIGVCDASGGTPIQRGIRPRDPRGRGLQLVDALASEWGVQWDGDGQHKTVWFLLRAASRDTPLGATSNPPAVPTG